VISIQRHVFFFNGPIGVGKTALGRAVAAELGASFIDSDGLGDPAKRWFEEALSAANALVEAGLAASREQPTVIVAKPLRARDWAFFSARFAAHGVRAHCVTLSAKPESILEPGRGRLLDREEQARMKQMVAQGYAARPFSDVIVETDRHGLAETTSILVEECRRSDGCQGERLVRIANWRMR
jgi:hypothetical protein